MDKKISELAIANTIIGGDLIPIVTGGVNKSVSAGVFTMNQPNIGNKGITKNAPIQAVSGTPIALTSTLVVLPATGTPYSLPNGVDGQEITLVSAGVCTVVPISSLITNIILNAGSTITLVYLEGTINKWVPKSYHNATLT